MAFALLLSYLLPYVEPRRFGFLSVLSLAVPFLILVNLLFLVYWLLKTKKQLFLSLFVLGLGYSHVLSLYKFSGSKHLDDRKNLLVMNYNVRLFNVYDWIDDPNVGKDIVDFIAEKKPDIICIQEYRKYDDFALVGYEKYEEFVGKKSSSGQAIFSKYPIIKSGSINFPKTFNNAIFADILKGNDTIRVYNVHLQSSGIQPDQEELTTENSESMVKRVSSTFKMQQSQTELFLKHKSKCPYQMIICGDFNNTAYSYVYKEIKGDLKDAFKRAGNGFGRTYDFKFFPVRIDFVLVDEGFEINAFKTFDVEYSDHFPIMAKIKLKSTTSSSSPPDLPSNE